MVRTVSDHCAAERGAFRPRRQTTASIHGCDAGALIALVWTGADWTNATGARDTKGRWGTGVVLAVERPGMDKLPDRRRHVLIDQLQYRLLKVNVVHLEMDPIGWTEIDFC